MALLLLILTFFILLRGFGASSLIFTIFNVFSNGSRQNFAEMRRDEKLRTQIETSRESEYFLGCTSRQVENLSTFLDANRDNSRFSTSWKFRDETGTRWDSRKKKSRNRDETILDPPLNFPAILILRNAKFSWFQKVKNSHCNNFEGFGFWFLGKKFTLENVKTSQKFKIRSCSNGKNGSTWGFKMTNIDLR